MQPEKKFPMMLELSELLGEHLPMLRMGAMLYHARPELGRLFVEVTAPEAPADADEELRDAAMRLVASDDNMLQTVIDLLADTQKYMEED